MKHTDKMLFVCVENAGRSQMAEALAKKLGLSTMSAGTLPATAVNPVVAAVMKERGIDISANHPKTLTMQMVNEVDLVVTSCLLLSDYVHYFVHHVHGLEVLVS